MTRRKYFIIDIDDLIKDLPKEIQEAIKTLCTTVYDRGYDNGLRVGAYAISDRILTLLRSETNPAKAKAKVISFICQNKDTKKKETETNEKISD